MTKTISSKNDKDPYIEILHRVLDEWVLCIDNLLLIVECWIPAVFEWSLFTFYLMSLTLSLLGPFFSLSLCRAAIFIIGNFPYFKKATLEVLGKKFRKQAVSFFSFFLVLFLFYLFWKCISQKYIHFCCPFFFFSAETIFATKTLGRQLALVSMSSLGIS